MQIHPDMMRWAEQRELQRKEQERAQAAALSQQAQAQAKASNHQHDLLSATRMAGA